MGNSILDAAALAYAERGWPVFPLHSPVANGCSCGRATCKDVGKHPRTQHGLHDSSLDPARVRDWWGRWPDANIAIVTGAASGIVLLDVDPRHGGDESLAQLASEIGPIPPTPMQRTGSGGAHYLFEHPGQEVRNRAGIYPGLDVRGDGGYFVAAPSLHASGQSYTWLTAPSAHPLAQIPPSLLARMLRVSSSSDGARAKFDAATVLAGVPEGSRDDALFRLACKLRHADVPIDLAKKLVLEAAGNCTPPFPADVALKKVTSAYSRYTASSGPMDQPWSPPAPFYVHSLPTFPTEVLSPWMRDFVEAEATTTQTPPELAGNLALTCCAAACARKIRIQVRPDWQEPLNIFTVTVLPPGARKTAVFATATAPLSAFERLVARTMEPTIVAAETSFRVLDLRRKKAEEAAAKAKPGDRESFERTAHEAAAELANVRVPARPRLIADDCTSERLSTLLENQDGRIAVMSPEGDVFELMAGRYSGNGAPNFGVYLKGHAGDDIRVDRVGRIAEYIQRPALTIGLTVQPDVLHSLVDKPGFRGRGLLGRFLYSLPPSPFGSRDPDPPPIATGVVEAYAAGITQLLNLPFAQDQDGNSAPHLLRLGAVASTLMRGLVEELEPKLARFEELGQMTDWAGKLAGAVARFAGLLHVADSVRNLRPWEIPIAAETVQRAIRFGRYYLAHAKAAYAEMGADPVVEDARYILGWIDKAGITSFSKRDVFEGTKGRFKRVAALEPALGLLVEHEYIRKRPQDPKPGPGRPPSDVFDVNPLIGNSANSANCARGISAETSSPNVDDSNSANTAKEDGGLVGDPSSSIGATSDCGVSPLLDPERPSQYSQYSHNSTQYPTNADSGLPPESPGDEETVL